MLRCLVDWLAGRVEARSGEISDRHHGRHKARVAGPRNSLDADCAKSDTASRRRTFSAWPFIG